MGQINSAQDSENSSQDFGTAEEDNIERDQRKEAASEQVRCVKTRIDMLIEDCLNTKDSTANFENEKNRTAEIQNINKLKQDNESEKAENIPKNENNSKESNKVKEKDKNEEKAKSSHVDTPKTFKEAENCSKRCCDDNCEKEGPAEEKKGDKEELKLHDLITDMVQSELTQKQLKQIQQRTIITFNTFIDKVLDNSLNQENSEEAKPKSSSILKLCSESMVPGSEQKTDESTNEVETNEKPECDRDNDKPKNIDKTKKVTLKDHIERFLELSFRDENTDEDKNKTDKNKNLQENFNAQGLVNSMITQGLQINRLLMTKEQQNSANQKPGPQKEYETPSKPSKFPDQNYKQSHETYRQKSPCSNHSVERSDLRNHHTVSNHQNMDVKFRDQYYFAAGNRHSEMSLGYARREEMLERNREIQSKMNAGAKGDISMMNNMKVAENMSAFNHPHALHSANSVYFNSPFGPRMQLSPGQLREMTSCGRRDGKHNVHVRDCMCAMCVHQPHSRHGMVDSVVMDHHAGKGSPNVPHPGLANSMAAHSHTGMVRDVPAVMRPAHSELPQGMVAYQGMHKLLPHHSLITSTKVYGTGHLLIPSEIPAAGMVHNRHQNMAENQSHLTHYHPRREEYSHSAVSNERQSIRSGKQSPYLVRPSSVPSQEHSGSIHPRPGSGHRFYETDYTRSTDSSSCTSEGSNEAPLDLSVKKSILEPRSRSSSNASGVRKIYPSNSFIKHLESSVDKYWQELNSPPSSPAITVAPPLVGRSYSPPDSRNLLQMFSQQKQQSPNGSSPPGMLTMMQNRPLPSPHYTGGITVGQPLVDMKPQGTQRQSEYQSNSISQTGSQAVYSHVAQATQFRQTNFDTNSKLNKQAQEQTQFQGNQSNYEMNSKKNGNNVSKHEPIQNIIGNHDPNDILYLICRLCTQTYGSPYGFRKHFRNQHGFEPRSDHTIVQTISATKTALHLPQPPLMQGISEIHESPVMRKSISPETEKPIKNNYSGRKSSSVSPTETKSLTGSEEGDKTESENTETKCLECPKCGKTFQLNDFGSYKRHCRQHGNVRMNGPFSCTDCHLPFPDQKSLHEHCVTHFQDKAVEVKHEQKNERSSQKNESHPTIYMCVTCEKQYENIESYQCHIATHERESKTKAVESCLSVKSGQNTVCRKSENDISTNIVTSLTVVKQAAESNTALVCPDSSWDNVAKVDATSDKPELIPDRSESTSSNSNISSEKLSNVDESKNSSPSLLTPQISVESGSENEKKCEQSEFNYKHKKFFHHRKRVGSSQSDCSDAKQAKLSPEVPAAVADNSNLPVSSSVATLVNPSCDSTGTTESKINENPITNENMKEKPAQKATERATKTEARHCLPFVWDRTTRSQKK